MPPDGIRIIEAGCIPPGDGALAEVGGKAFNLLKLAAEGFHVPPGFVLPTSMCADWIARDVPPLDDFHALVLGPLDGLAQITGLAFGDPRRPLLVSVRSGAPASMPGMLDTVLNVGLTRATLPGLIALTGNPRLAWDCYLRLIQSYAGSVHRLDGTRFDEATARAISAAGAANPAELDTLSLRDLAQRYLDVFEDAVGEAFPDDPMKQLLRAVDAVFRSWNSERAKSYRRINRLDGLPGTAVMVQRMVYGNAGPRSGAGVGFTRDPATGDKHLYLDFAFDAQGEDVVSGRRHLTPASELARILPKVFTALDHLAAKLEQTFRDAQEFEFTVEEGELFLLQTREAKRSAWARLKIAVDLACEGVITPEETLRRLKGLDLTVLRHRRVKPGQGDAITQGTPAGTGVASGAIALTIDAARREAARGNAVILVRNDIATEDIDGIANSAGVLTARGGRTSHAAVVARELGKVAIVGCADLALAADEQSCTIAGRRFEAGAQLTLDSDTGRVYAGTVEVSEEQPLEQLAQVEAWEAQLESSSS